jgi:hypothetical protein
LAPRSLLASKAWGIWGSPKIGVSIMLSVNRSKVARLLVGAALAAGAVAWQAKDAVAARRLTLFVSRSNPSCAFSPGGAVFYGYGRGLDLSSQNVCNVAATGGTAFNDSPACAGAVSHQPVLVSQPNGAGNPVVQPGCIGAIQVTWTTQQMLVCSTPNSSNCPGGSTWTVISQGAN